MQHHLSQEEAAKTVLTDDGALPLAIPRDRCGTLPTEEAATKLIWLALRNITATWKVGGPEGLALRRRHPNTEHPEHEHRTMNAAPRTLRWHDER